MKGKNYMKFNICKCGKYYMTISYKGYETARDDSIAILLNISYEKYINILKLNDAKINIDGYFFETKENCEKFIEYIKEKFSDRLVYLKLMENK
jgi:hypothetical protein